MARHRGEEFWKKAVGEVAGGVAQTVVARKYGVSLSGLRLWIRRLSAARPSSPAVSMARVELGGHRRPRLELGLGGGVTLRFPAEVAPEYIAALVMAFRRVPC